MSPLSHTNISGFSIFLVVSSLCTIACWVSSVPSLLLHGLNEPCHCLVGMVTSVVLFSALLNTSLLVTRSAHNILYSLPVVSNVSILFTPLLHTDTSLPWMRVSTSNPRNLCVYCKFRVICMLVKNSIFARPILLSVIELLFLPNFHVLLWAIGETHFSLAEGVGFPKNIHLCSIFFLICHQFIITSVSAVLRPFLPVAGFIYAALSIVKVRRID